LTERKEREAEAYSTKPEENTKGKNPHVKVSTNPDGSKRRVIDGDNISLDDWKKLGFSVG